MTWKTLFLIPILYFSYVRSVAQERLYFQHTELGIAWGKSQRNWDGSQEKRQDFTLMTFHGVKIAPKMVIGFSTGLDRYQGVSLVPIALGWRGFLGKITKPQLFVGADVGGGSAIFEKKVSTEWEDRWYEGGAMLSGMVGVRFPAKKGKNALTVSFGAKRQFLSYFQGQKTGIIIGPGLVEDLPNLPRGYQSISETSYLFNSLYARVGMTF
ncbi:MAG: hypothetical protein B7Z16_09480 [Algoriphagus sp. 32-45-6]|nr:MAG: hypothetical protein B7Z16_09480 [Algoriphagus sp. 32-45-6]